MNKNDVKDLVDISLEADSKVYEVKSSSSSNHVISIANSKDSIIDYGNSVKVFETKKTEESLEQKMARIKRELESLSEIVGETKISSLLDLYNKLTINNNVEFTEIHNKIGFDDNNEDERELKNIKLPSTIQFDYECTRIFSSLEKRVTKLEQLVGYDATMLKNHETITSKINTLYRKLELIEDNKQTMLDKFSERMKKLNTDYEDSLMRRSADINSEVEKDLKDKMVNREDKIDELYSFYQSVQNYDEVLPKLVKRLENLNALSMKLDDSSEVILSLNDKIEWLEEQCNAWQSTVEMLETARERSEGQEQK
ncbi:uncharacterized protein SCODWIG_01370 [Saccharomycodes ludwigii]|uniref:Uncharacterized protein n=1 Tax=Saccharomycodes ludwigii TaxID=36035 RepID=A0A376B4V2_9ASCO|nr:uncharacterized protein SCODWIG_01370 [Saccharomycodes ludwigii]